MNSLTIGFSCMQSATKVRLLVKYKYANVCSDFIRKKSKCTDYVDDLSDIFVLFVNSFILHVACMIIVVKS